MVTGGPGLIQTLKETQEHPSMLQAEQIKKLLESFMRIINNIIINGHEYFMAGVVLM